jgi:metal-sulfur cluster biosynthetic enzyme
MSVIHDLIDKNVREISGVSDVQVEITFDPPWTEDKMSRKAKTQLGIE